MRVGADRARLWGMLAYIARAPVKYLQHLTVGVRTCYTQERHYNIQSCFDSGFRRSNAMQPSTPQTGQIDQLYQTDQIDPGLSTDSTQATRPKIMQLFTAPTLQHELGQTDRESICPSERFKS